MARNSKSLYHCVLSHQLKNAQEASGLSSKAKREPEGTHSPRLSATHYFCFRFSKGDVMGTVKSSWLPQFMLCFTCISPYTFLLWTSLPENKLKIGRFMGQTIVSTTAFNFGAETHTHPVPFPPSVLNFLVFSYPLCWS